MKLTAMTNPALHPPPRTFEAHQSLHHDADDGFG